MTTPPEDEGGKLTPEQSGALIRWERGRRSRNVVATVCTVLWTALLIFTFLFPRIWPFAMVAIIGLVMFHVAWINRQVDPLVKLLDQDSKQASERQAR